MARAAPLSYATAASLALHALGLLAVAAMLKQVPGHAYSLPIVARLAAPEPVVLEAAKPAPKERAARQKAMPVPPLPPADTATVAQFRQQFIGSAARFLDYPPDALNAEVEGAVVVSVSFAAGRGAAAISVTRSSGHHLLDAQALDMFRRAAASMPLPGALRAQDFEFEVPVVYALKR
ncbi:MAG TPA: TonB family protein [Burkholderiales bacterium]|nr:TonB family protein [Burkholderiales bacterium]